MTVVGQRDIMGLNTDTEALRFGTLRPGVGSSRFVEVSSKKSSWVTVQLKGSLAPWVWISNESFLLNKGNMDKIQFKLDVPNSAENGNYTGTAVFIFREPWINRLETFK